MHIFGIAIDKGFKYSILSTVPYIKKYRGQVMTLTKNDELNQLRKIRINDLHVDSRITEGIAKLLGKNENAGIKMSMYDGGYTLFPPSQFKPKGGQISVTVFLTDHGVDIYPPSTTCQMDVAFIGVSDDGMLNIRMRAFDLYWEYYQVFDKISQYNGPEPQGTISLEEVRSIFSEIQEDIREVFESER